MEKITRVYYVAFDGEEFDTKEECTAYEDALQRTKGIIGFDENKSVTDGAEELATSAAYYFITNANEASQTFSVLYDQYGTEIPHEFADGDFYRYDDDNDRWVNMLYEFCKLGDVIATIANHVRLLAKTDASMKHAWSVAREYLAHCPNVVAIAYME